MTAPRLSRLFKSNRLKVSLTNLTQIQPDTVYLRDGEVILYRRSRSLLYQCRYKLSDGSWVRRTTAKASLEHAVAVACDLYDESRYRQKLGLAHQAHWHSLKPSYDTRKDFTPVSLLANLPMMVAGRRKFSAKNMNESVQAAKAALGHLTAEYFSSIAGIKMTHMPYKGSAGVVNAMLVGDIDLTFDRISTPMPQIRSGNFSALALESRDRHAVASISVSGSVDRKRLRACGLSARGFADAHRARNHTLVGGGEVHRRQD